MLALIITQRLLHCQKSSSAPSEALLLLLLLLYPCVCFYFLVVVVVVAASAFLLSVVPTFLSLSLNWPAAKTGNVSEMLASVSLFLFLFSTHRNI